MSEFIHFNGGNTEDFNLGGGFNIVELKEGEDLLEYVKESVEDTFLQNYFLSRYESGEGYKVEVDVDSREFELTVYFGEDREVVWGSF